MGFTLLSTFGASTNDSPIGFVRSYQIKPKTHKNTIKKVKQPIAGSRTITPLLFRIGSHSTKITYMKINRKLKNNKNSKII